MSDRRHRSARDGRLVRALAEGKTSAIAPLFDRHLPRVYGLLRMALPSEAEVEEALTDVFCSAAERATDPIARANPEEWLVGLALEQVELRAIPGPPVSLEERRRARDGHDAGVAEEPATEPADEAEPFDDTALAVDADSIAGISDRALGVLVRTLDLRSRQALVLGVIAGLDDATVASTIACQPWEVEGLKQDALAGLGELLGEHERREAELKRQIDEIPYKLRPLPTGDAYGEGAAAGSTVVIGPRVHLEPTPHEQGILNLMRRALKRLSALFRRHRHAIDLADDIGDTGPRRTVEPTPGQRAFERPGATPTTRGYRSPKLSPGVAIYAMPRSTPTTRRLSNRRRPLPPTKGR